jgi:hypothetical protein
MSRLHIDAQHLGPNPNPKSIGPCAATGTDHIEHASTGGLAALRRVKSNEYKTDMRICVAQQNLSGINGQIQAACMPG